MGKRNTGYITEGQKRFLLDLLKSTPAAKNLIELRGLHNGDVDFLSEQAASSIIGQIQAARSPRPALRKAAA